MTGEHEPQVTPIIQRTTVADIPALRRMHAVAWNDTYPNEAAGVSEDWVRAETDTWLTPEGLNRSIEWLTPLFENPDHLHEIAKVNDDIVALVHVSKVDGDQRLGGLYLAAAQRGTGLAQRLMADAMAFLDLTKPITLEVARYNERAQAFYRKNGFEVVPGTEGMFKDKIPDIKMVRTGDES